MSHVKSIQSSIKIIQETYHKLESKELSMEELDVFVNAAQELHERAVILRYKAYESKIQTAHSNVNQKIEAEYLSIQPLQPEETKEEAEIEKVQLEKEEAKPIEQTDYTETEVVESSFSFDLFNDNAQVLREEAIEEGAVESINVTSSSHEENGVLEEHLIMEQVKKVPTDEENKEFIDLYSVIESDLFNQIGMSRLDTLNNCFGLNEKFVCINELFNGSKDDFNDAILKLDNEASYHEALLTASAYANQFNWNVEGSTVKDFITKLKRRYG
jgi:hypothetical protein